MRTPSSQPHLANSYPGDLVPASAFTVQTRHPARPGLVGAAGALLSRGAGLSRGVELTPHFRIRSGRASLVYLAQVRLPARCLGTGVGKSPGSSSRPQSGVPSLYALALWPLPRRKAEWGILDQKFLRRNEVFLPSFPGL